MTTGRPRASSPEILAEAACELFLEKGYEATTVADIAARAGVSRSGFFNYFASKGDILWSGLDARIAESEGELRAGADVAGALRGIGTGFTPDSLALALLNAAAMNAEEELEREASARRARIAAAVRERLRSAGVGSLEAEVAGAAHGGAVIAAVAAWARRGAGTSDLTGLLDEALRAAARTLPGPVRQLRVVARADDFAGALAFYRDVLGMAEQEAYEGDGGARVAILDAGRATVELANAAQIDLIDRVETDGDAPSERIRIGLEVSDAVGTTAAALGAGALLEAAPRETPWGSLNARVGGPAGLQLTFFEERGRTSRPDDAEV